MAGAETVEIVAAEEATDADILAAADNFGGGIYQGEVVEVEAKII